MVEIINVIDDCTRVLIASMAVPTCTTANSWDALCAGAQQWGWPERVLSDNGMAFRGPAGNGGLLPALAALGIEDRHSRPYHPQTCGKVERFHQTLKLHLNRHDLTATLAELQADLDRFREIYNHHRPHRAIGRRFPADVGHADTTLRPRQHPLSTATTPHTLVTATVGSSRHPHPCWHRHRSRRQDCDHRDHGTNAQSPRASRPWSRGEWLGRR